MTITAKVICDSFNELLSTRLTTMELHYPRFIHAEFMTHRVFSRNASSSRAIPVTRQMEMIQQDTAMPIHWGKNQPGMQATEEFNYADQQGMEILWNKARDYALEVAGKMVEMGAHKQIVNRILEPFSHIRVLVSSTDWNNFFALRDHPDAQPEIRELAIQMKEALTASIPTAVRPGMWHLPYITEADWDAVLEYLQQGRITRDIPPMAERHATLCAISAARCARVSYLNHEGKTTTMDEDLKLYFRLVQANPPHMSPCEHQAKAMSNRGLFQNFRDWEQFRTTIHGNTVYG